MEANAGAEAEAKALAKAKAKAKAAANKSPESIQRDERLEANFKKYEHLADEELKEMLPKKADGGFTSIGAMLHSSGLCATCIFHHSPKGCYNQMKCRFCHHDHTKPSRAKSRKKKKIDGDDAEDEGGKQKKMRPGGDSDYARRRRNGGLEAPGTPELDDLGNSRPCWILPGEESYPYGMSRPPPSFAGGDPYAWRPPPHDGDPYAWRPPPHEDPYGRPPEGVDPYAGRLPPEQSDPYAGRLPPEDPYARRPPHDRDYHP